MQNASTVRAKKPCMRILPERVGTVPSRTNGIPFSSLMQEIRTQTPFSLISVSFDWYFENKNGVVGKIWSYKSTTDFWKWNLWKSRKMEKFTKFNETHQNLVNFTKFHQKWRIPPLYNQNAIFRKMGLRIIEIPLYYQHFSAWGADGALLTLFALFRISAIFSKFHENH